jgi:hypothetical protein
MKKGLFILALIFTINATYSQKIKKSSSSSSSSDGGSRSSSYGFKEGDFVVTGAFGVTSSSAGGTSNTSFKILPSLGYFISDKIAIGGTLGYEKNGGGLAGGVVTGGTNNFIVGAFGRYFITPKSQFSLFGQGLLKFISSSPEGGSGSNTTFGLGFSPGLNYFVSSRFSLEATFGEVGFESQSASGGGGSNTGIKFGLDMTDINLGLTYKF